MAKLLKIDNSHDPGHDEYLFRCPGCKKAHTFITKWGAWNLEWRKKAWPNESVPTWQFNGDMENPTFSPSLVYNWKYGDGRANDCCHLYLRNGILEFLSDCTHELAGKKVPMIKLEDL